MGSADDVRCFEKSQTDAFDELIRDYYYDDDDCDDELRDEIADETLENFPDEVFVVAAELLDSSLPSSRHSLS